MSPSHLTRRRFVVAVIALSGAAGATLSPGLFSLSRAWARSPNRVDEAVRHAMVRMARLLFPHDALADDVYAEVLDRALSDVATGADFAADLEAAFAALADRFGGDWRALDAAGQVEVMQGIETAEFFVAIQNAVRAGIYNGAAFWKHIGYPGPSKDFGGYLGRGAGEIDWLPEGS
jgi:glycine/D-amino acid oxidase-like deaminating enzyme